MSREEEIRGRLEAATPGPWEARESAVLGPREADDKGRGPSRLAAMQMPWRTPRQKANAEFIAHARQDIPHLLDELERVKRGARTLGETIEKDCEWVLNATGLHHMVDEDGDGDWMAIWENLLELRPERDRLLERNAELEGAVRAVEELIEPYVTRDAISGSIDETRKVHVRVADLRVALNQGGETNGE